MKKIAAFTLINCCLASAAFANEQTGYFIKPYIGLSQMSDLKADTIDIGTTDGKADIDLDSGFVAGLGFGYRYNPNVSVELAWEYRSNDSATTLADGDEFSDGNYASNLFFINGYYHLAQQGKWQPYIGAGLSWAQEIDIDLEKDGEEFSYSGDGDIGLQLFAGSDYKLTDNFSINGELRYGRISGIELSGEGNTGKIEGLYYETLTAQIGLSYLF